MTIKTRHAAAIPAERNAHEKEKPILNSPDEEKRISERFERIERLLDSTATNFKTNLELLQDFMSQSGQRFEERIEKTQAQHNELGQIVTRIAQLLERHLRDHNGDEE
jgi:hypothetical protein